MDEDRKILGVRKNIFFLGLVSFFNDFSAEMTQAVMPVFITSVLGAPAFFVGLIEGVADALSSILKLISGWISDRIQKRKMPAVIGYAVSVVSRSLLALTNHFSQVLGLRLVDRIGKGLRDSPRDALITESVPQEELGKSFGFHRAMDTLGATIGPLSAFLLLPLLAGNYRQLFIISSILGLFAIVSFVLVKDRPKSLDAEKPRPRFDWTIFSENKKFVSVVASIFVFGLGTLPIGLILLKAKEVGMIGDVPLMYFVYSLAFVLTSIPLGRLADRIGETYVIAAGFIFAIIAYIGLSHTSHIVSLAFFFVILGIYSAATDGMQRMLASKSLEKNLIATGQGFLNMAIGFSSLGAGLVGGWLWTNINSAVALEYAAALSFVGLVLFIIMVSRKAPPVIKRVNG